MPTDDGCVPTAQKLQRSKSECQREKRVNDRIGSFVQGGVESSVRACQNTD